MFNKKVVGLLTTLFGLGGCDGSVNYTGPEATPTTPISLKSLPQSGGSAQQFAVACGHITPASVCYNEKTHSLILDGNLTELTCDSPDGKNSARIVRNGNEATLVVTEKDGSDLVSSFVVTPSTLEDKKNLANTLCLK